MAETKEGQQDGHDVPEPVVASGTLSLHASTWLTAEVKISYNHRCWKVHWGHIQRAYDTLKADYSGPVDHNKVIFDVDTFFIFGAHLPEWMKGDKSDSCLLTQPQVDEIDALEATERALELGRAIANTEKHHTRNGGITAFVDQVAILSGEKGTKAKITVVGSSVPEDALDLANRIIIAWESFFARHNLKVS